MLGMDIKTNGLLNALPMLSRYVGGVAFGHLADFLLGREILSVTALRRVFNSISSVRLMYVLVLKSPMYSQAIHSLYRLARAFSSSDSLTLAATRCS